MTSNFKSSVSTISLLILSSFTACLAATSECSDGDTSNSAASNIVLQSQTASFSPVEIQPKQTLLQGTHVLTEINNCQQSSAVESNNTPKSLAQTNNAQQALPIYLRRIIPITLESAVDSKLVKPGDDIIAKLKENLYYGTRLIAPIDSTLRGKVFSIRSSRTLSQASIKKEDRFKSSASLEIIFDSICIDRNYIIPIAARPVHQECTRIGDDGLLYGIKVDHNGKITQGGRTLSQNQKYTYTVIRLSTGIPIPAGFFANIAAAPFIMGSIGAICPDIAFNKATDPAMTHKRLKGASYGFVTNLPGAFLVQAVVEKGDEILLYKGDQLMIDLSINNQVIGQLPKLNKEPRALVVEAKLLDKEDTKQKNSALPLKSYLDESIIDPTHRQVESANTTLSGLSSPVAN